MMDAALPRRLKRWLLIYAVLLVGAWLGWRKIASPRWTEYRIIQKSLDTADRDVFGSATRPNFSDMIMVHDLEKELQLGPKKERLIFIGDVHGCIDELKTLLSTVNYKPKTDHLIFTGDMIAKGPDSPGVVEFALSVSASCVRGNHEDRMLLAWRDTHPHFGAFDTDKADPTPFVTQADHGDSEARLLAKQFSLPQIKWLQACPVILNVGQISGLGEVAVVHAGLVPGVKLEHQDPFQSMNMRTIDVHTHLPSQSREGMPWEKLWNGYQKSIAKKERTTVIYGHDSRRGLNIAKYSKGLDSGCVRGDKLTAMVVEKGWNGKASQWYKSVGCKAYV